jgi:peptidoglycan/LPS O-acetylase OafA/YrhL
LAVIAVITYHFNPTWLQGGFLGVDLFFVLSGYLITSILLNEYNQNGRLSLKRFWMGRVRRLFPAAYTMIILVVIFCLLFNRHLLELLKGDAISSLFYTSNWWFIFHKVSYFDSFGSPSPLKNLWSLAIEEQFYLIWPFLLLIGFAFFKKRAFALIILCGAFCSAVSMFILYHPGADPSRIYYGTDTRSFELLIGGYLAMVWPMNQLTSNKLPVPAKILLDAAGTASLVILLYSLVDTNEYTPFLYEGGMFLFSINTAIFLSCISHPGSFLGKVFSWKPLRWIGTRSYGFYLWHYPIIVLTTPVSEIGNPVMWHVILQIIATVLITEASYRLIELPIRKQGFKPFLQASFGGASVHKTTKFLIPGVLFLFIIGLAIPASVFKGPQVQTNHQPVQLAISHNSLADNHDTGTKLEVPQNGKSRDEKKQAGPDKILAMGDSVMLDITKDLLKTHGNITIDGKVGRQVSDALKLANDYRSFNSTNAAVVIELGTNGYFTSDQIHSLLDDFHHAHIFLVNTRVPRPWEAAVNKSLSQVDDELANVTLVDWHAVAISHPDYFTPDGVHLNTKGSLALTKLINSTMASFYEEKSTIG